MTRDPIPTLSTLISPTLIETFVARTWGQHAAVFRGEPSTLGRLRAATKWRESTWLNEIDAASQDAQGVQSQHRVTRAAAPEHYARGATLCAEISNDPTVAAFLSSFGPQLGVAGRPFAKLYASPPGAGFAMHFDGHHVFVVQLSGRKQWWFSDRPALWCPPHSGKAIDGQALWAAPREGEVTDDARSPLAVPDRSALRDAILEPGDCLYLPPGTWHTTAAERHSVAISASPAKVPVSYWVLQVLAQLAESRAACRSDVIAGEVAFCDGKVAPPVAASVDACITELRDLLGAIDPRQVHRAWLGALRGEDQTMPPPAITLTASTRLGPATPQSLQYLVAPESVGDKDAIHLYGGGAEWSLPGQVQAFVDAARQRESFTVAEALAFDPIMDPADATSLLAQLVEAGLLVARATPSITRRGEP